MLSLITQNIIQKTKEYMTWKSEQDDKMKSKERKGSFMESSMRSRLQSFVRKNFVYEK